MAATDYPSGHALTVKLWSSRVIREALKMTQAMKFMGTSSNSLCQVFEDTQKSAGDRVRIPLRMQLSGRGVGEDEALEGSEETLTTYYDDLSINEMFHAVRNKTVMAQQRVPWNIRSEGAAGIRDWYRDRIDTWFFNALTGNTGEADTLYTGHNATTAPTSASGNTRILYTGGHGSEVSLSTTNTFNLTLLDAAVAQAKTATPLIRPVTVGSSDYYVAFLHPWQINSMRTNTNTGQWFDIQKAAMSGGDIEDNPIFSGAHGVYNGVVIHESTRIPVAPTNSNVRRAVFCGAQAAAMAFGKGYSGESADYREESFDYGRQFGQSVGTVAGIKKTVFNSIDFGTIVMASYASAPVAT